VPQNEVEPQIQTPPVEVQEPSLSENPIAEWNAAAEQVESLSRDFEAFDERANRLWDETPLKETEP
jgi:hypothetical protein